MYRISNTITLRKYFLWNSQWYCDYHYYNLLFQDIKINNYLKSLFSFIKFPASNFIIKRHLLKLIILSNIHMIFLWNKKVKIRKLIFLIKRHKKYFINHLIFKKNVYFFFKIIYMFILIHVLFKDFSYKSKHMLSLNINKIRYRSLKHFFINKKVFIKKKQLKKKHNINHKYNYKKNVKYSNPFQKKLNTKNNIKANTNINNKYNINKFNNKNSIKYNTNVKNKYNIKKFNNKNSMTSTTKIKNNFNHQNNIKANTNVKNKYNIKTFHNKNHIKSNNYLKNKNNKSLNVVKRKYSTTINTLNTTFLNKKRFFNPVFYLRIKKVKANKKKIKSKKVKTNKKKIKSKKLKTNKKKIKSKKVKIYKKKTNIKQSNFFFYKFLYLSKLITHNIHMHFTYTYLKQNSLNLLLRYRNHFSLFSNDTQIINNFLSLKYYTLKKHSLFFKKLYFSYLPSNKSFFKYFFYHKKFKLKKQEKNDFIYNYNRYYFSELHSFYTLNYFYMKNNNIFHYIKYKSLINRKSLNIKESSSLKLHYKKAIKLIDNSLIIKKNIKKNLIKKNLSTFLKRAFKHNSFKKILSCLKGTKYHINNTTNKYNTNINIFNSKNNIKSNTNTNIKNKYNINKFNNKNNKYSNNLFHNKKSGYCTYNSNNKTSLYKEINTIKEWFYYINKHSFFYYKNFFFMYFLNSLNIQVYNYTQLYNFKTFFNYYLINYVILKLHKKLNILIKKKHFKKPKKLCTYYVFNCKTMKKNTYNSRNIKLFFVFFLKSPILYKYMNRKKLLLNIRITYSLKNIIFFLENHITFMDHSVYRKKNFKKITLTIIHKNRIDYIKNRYSKVVKYSFWKNNLSMKLESKNVYKVCMKLNSNSSYTFSTLYIKKYNFLFKKISSDLSTLDYERRNKYKKKYKYFLLPSFTSWIHKPINLTYYFSVDQWLILKESLYQKKGINKQKYIHDSIFKKKLIANVRKNKIRRIWNKHLRFNKKLNLSKKNKFNINKNNNLNISKNKKFNVSKKNKKFKINKKNLNSFLNNYFNYSFIFYISNSYFFYKKITIHINSFYKSLHIIKLLNTIMFLKFYVKNTNNIILSKIYNYVFSYNTIASFISFKRINKLLYYLFLYTLNKKKKKYSFLFKYKLFNIYYIRYLVKKKKINNSLVFILEHILLKRIIFKYFYINDKYFFSFFITKNKNFLNILLKYKKFKTYISNSYSYYNVFILFNNYYLLLKKSFFIFFNNLSKRFINKTLLPYLFSYINFKKQRNYIFNYSYSSIIHVFKNKYKHKCLFLLRFIYLYYLFHKNKKYKYNYNLLIIYFKNKKINKLNIIKKHIYDKMNYSIFSFNSINYKYHDSTYKYLIKSYLLYCFNSYYFNNTYLFSSINSYVFLINTNIYNFRDFYDSFFVFDWIFKKKIFFLINIFLFFIKYFILLSIKKSLFITDKMPASYGVRCYSSIFLDLNLNKLFNVIINHNIVGSYIRYCTLVLNHYNYIFNKSFTHNYINDIMYISMLRNNSFYHSYLKYYILNFLYLFYSIEKSISRYSSTNCYLLITYSLKWKYTLNSAKMWCEYMVYHFKKKNTIRRLFFFIKRQQMKEERARKYFTLYGTSLEKFLLFYKYPLRGIRIVYSGNFKKAKRKKKYLYYIWLSNAKFSGRMPLQRFKYYIDYYFSSITLKRSIVGLKFWLLYNLW